MPVDLPGEYIIIYYIFWANCLVCLLLNRLYSIPLCDFQQRTWATYVYLTNLANHVQQFMILTALTACLWCVILVYCHLLYFLKCYQIIQTPGLWETDHKGFSLSGNDTAGNSGLCGSGYCIVWRSAQITRYGTLHTSWNQSKHTISHLSCLPAASN